MSRYIDADAFLKEYCEPYPHVFMAMSKAMAEAPHIDIVRCKECRYCHRNYVDMTPPYQHDYCYKFSRYMDADDFCSYGEREDE